MEIWKGDFELIRHWMFMSASEEIPLHNDSITLKMVGETSPRIVTLRAKIIDEPTSEIFVYLKNKFYHLCVKPHDKLYDILWRLPEKPKFLEYDGLPLNVMHTIQQSGLKDKSVLYEPLCSISVKLSSGYTNVFQMSPNSIVHQLKEKVNVYETNDFSLTYQGRYLKSDESVRLLTQVVEVTTAHFVVNVQDQCVSWITKKEPIEVSEFLCQLAAKANINTQTFDRFEFVCVGCQRRIRQSNNYVQKLPVECCGEMSLTLDAVSLSDSGTTSEVNDNTNQIQTLHKHLVEHRSKDSRSATSRRLCKEIKDKFTKKGLDYNVVTRCSDSLLRTINKLADKIKKLNVVLETLKNQKSESEKEIEWLHSRDVRAMEEIEILKKEKKKIVEENRRLKNEHNLEIEMLKMQIKTMIEENTKLKNAHNSEIGILKVQNKTMIEENTKLKNEHNSEIEMLKMQNKTMLEENTKLKNAHNSEIEILKVQNKTMIEENTKLKNEHNSEIEILKMQNKTMLEENKKMIEKNERLKKEQKSVSLETNLRGAIGPGPSRSPTSYVKRGVKLLIVFSPEYFFPASCSEVTSRGQWPFSISFAYIKCDVHGIRPGLTPFKEVAAVLQLLFIREKISKIQQWLGSVARRTVTRATSRDGDEAARYDISPYCGVDGAEHSWQEAGKPGLQEIDEGGNVFVCGGERRTVMMIR